MPNIFATLKPTNSGIAQDLLVLKTSAKVQKIVNMFMLLQNKFQFLTQRLVLILCLKLFQ